MLRRSQSNTATSDAAESSSPPQAEERVAIPVADRRRGDRRGIDQLRAEALKSVVAQVEDRNFGGLRERIHVGRSVRSPRVLLLAVALIAGGLAAVLSTQRDEAVGAAVVESDPVVVEEARMQVLVAVGPVVAGARLTTDVLAWQDWPLSAVRDEYITLEESPEAALELTGRVTRFALFAGEPIREEKLGGTLEGSYLATVLETGKRGVSVSVSAEAASGGFVAPNDRVDVVLTRPQRGGPLDGAQRAETILSNVRVLAINAFVGEQDNTAEGSAPAVFGSQAIATFELDSTEAEVIMAAVSMGRLSLVLRSTADADDAATAEQRAANQAIRFTSPFWAN